MPDPRKIGYAVVGLGRISQGAVLPGFRNTRSARLAALVSGDPDKRRRVAERYGLGADDTHGYEEFEACLSRDDVDAAYLALPHHLHREYTERAAAQGVHVLCEKPMAVTESECRAMIDACRDGGVKLMVAYRLHLDPANLAAVERIEEGAIGSTRLFTSTFTLQVPEGDFRVAPSERGGGPLYDVGIYCINAARYVFRAEPERVWAMRASRPQERFEDVEEMLSCVLAFPGDRLASFTCSFGAHAGSSFQVVGDAGELRLENAYPFRGERRLTERRVDGEGPSVRERAFPETDQFGTQLDYFARCVLEGKDPEPDGEEGLVDVQVIRALYRALDRGTIVDVELGRDRRPTPDMAMEYPAVDGAGVGARAPSS
jgi:predicted dehydrogenase